MIDLSYRPRRAAQQKWEPEEIVLGVITAGMWIWIAVAIAGAL